MVGDLDRNSIETNPKQSFGFLEAKKKNIAKTFRLWRARTVKQREDCGTSERSDQQSKKDGANFWIHI
jgi:hypothetical protein